VRKKKEDEGRKNTTNKKMIRKISRREMKK
jgi:hypothetical protein